MRRFVFELIDLPYMARPSLKAMDVGKTADRIRQLRDHGGRRSYAAVMQMIGQMASGHCNPEHIARAFADFPDKVWKLELIDVGERLLSIFETTRGNWYPSRPKPIELYEGVWVKPTIRGILWSEGFARATLINPRKSLVLDHYARAFQARGVYEFHMMDDPNVHGFRLIDLGADRGCEERATRVYRSEEVDMIGLEEFEEAIRTFMKAVELAGYSSLPRDEHRVVDMFRRPPR